MPPSPPVVIVDACGTIESVQWVVDPKGPMWRGACTTHAPAPILNIACLLACPLDKSIDRSVDRDGPPLQPHTTTLEMKHPPTVVVVAPAAARAPALAAAVLPMRWA